MYPIARHRPQRLHFEHDRGAPGPLPAPRSLHYADDAPEVLADVIPDVSLEHYADYLKPLVRAPQVATERIPFSVPERPRPLVR